MFRFALILIILCLPGVAAAQTSIAVVDVKTLMTSSVAALSIQDQREALKNTYLQEITSREQALRDLEESLSEEKDALKSQTERQKYEAMLLEVRKFSQDRKRALEKASRDATETLRETLYVVVQELANEHEYGLVISNQNVIAGEKSLDITEEALKRLNESFPEISLKTEP
jgi:outer membrane protein